MKLSQVQENIATINNTSGEITSFKVKNSAKAFSILSSGIYANKIKAIIRELSCNAYDSHIEAGKKDIPFEIHLPTYFEPYFYVRDFGTGLTHQQVFDVYTTYFESTKTNSNDYIGALGLGSKSPFSYTENFTITAIRDGRKGVYSAFINDDGFPSVVLMTDETTDEPNGVEVKFAVENQSDFIKFMLEARNVLQHFTLKPKITGKKDVEIPEKEYLYKDISKNIHVLKNSYRNSFAIMGNICYPIDIGSLKNHIENKTLLDYLDYGIEFYFDIGEVEFQTSREGLSYTKKTIQSIEKKLIELDSSLEKTIKEKLDSYDNVWKKLQKTKELIEGNRIFHPAVSKYLEKYSNNANPNRYIHSNTSYHGKNKKYYIMVDASILKKFNIRIKGFRDDNRFEKYNASNLKEYNIDPFGIIQIPVSNLTFFVTNKKKNGAVLRAKYNFDLSNSEALIVIEKGDYDDNKEPDFEGFFESIFNPPKEQIYDVNNLEKRPTTRGEKLTSILTINTNPRHHYRMNEPEYIWEESNFIDIDDSTTKYFYIPLSGYDPICDDNTKKITNVKGFYNFIIKEDLSERLGFGSNVKFYGIRKKDIEKIKNKDNWIDIQEHMASLSPSLVENIYYGFMLYMETKSIYDFITYNDLIVKNLRNDSYFKKAMDIIEKNVINIQSLETYNNIDNFLFIDYHLGAEKKEKLKKEAENIRLTLLEKYPMLQYIESLRNVKYERNKMTRDIAEYINIMEKI